jgi:CheY-like chemotaxis protein
MKVQRTLSDAPASILLIHHNRSGLAARKCVLEELGHSVTAVSSPQDGLQRFAETKFDLVITDYRMPHMNGDALISRIHELRGDVPVILISGVVQALGLNEENTGADVVIQKNNIEVPQLTRAVKRLLERKSEKKPVRAQAATKKAAKGKSA